MKSMLSINRNIVTARRNKFNSEVTVVLGTQWGDEGKGRTVDMLAADMDIVCRCQGGNNAGHTVVANGIEYHFHMLPSGIINEKCFSVIGNGVVIHLPGLFEELAELELKGVLSPEKRLIISDRAHLVFDFHQKVDELQEAERSRSGTALGTIHRGIGPTYSSKANRIGIRVENLLGDFDLFAEKFKSLVSQYQKIYPDLVVDIAAELKTYKIYAEKIRPMVKNTVIYLNNALKEGRSIVAEGAQSTMLDIDFGTYPYVTSSNCSIGGVLTGLGLPPHAIGDVIGVVKSYTTRVSQGPFPTEQPNEVGALLQARGGEVGVLTRRNRRCGWIDMILLKYTCIINGYTAISLTKLDILDVFDEIKIGISYKQNGEKLDFFSGSSCNLDKVEVEYITFPGWKTSTENIRDYNELPVNAKNYLRYIEQYLDVPIKWVTVGRDRESVIKVF